MRLARFALVVAIGVLAPAAPALATSPTLTWSAPTAIDLGGGSGQPLDAVSCSSASECTAVDASGSGREITFTPSTPSDAVAATIDPGVHFSGVSCPAGNQCTAVFGTHDEITFNPSDPGTPTPVSVVSSGGLIAVSCPTSTLCMAVGTGGVSASFDPINGQLVAQFPSPFDGSAQLQAVTCVSVDACVVVDTVGNVITVDPDYNDGGSIVMNVTAANPLDTSGNPFPAGVACPSSTLCTLTDAEGDAVSFDPANDDGLAALKQIDASGTTSVSCLSVTECTSVDQSGEEVDFNPEDALHSNQVTVTTGPTSVDSSSTALAVSCPTTGSDCAAVDQVGGEVTYNPASPVAQAPTTIDAGNELTGLSCPAANQCSAVDAAGNELTFDPTDPGTPAALAVGGLFAGLSCVSTAQCTAVDDDSQQATFFGSNAPTETTLSGLGQAVAVACPSLSQCTAVNTAGTEVTFDPTSGTETGGVHDIDSGFELDAIACPTSALCIAGDNDSAAGARYISFNPNPFTVIQPLTSLLSAGDDSITAIACPSASQCTAASYYGQQVTLDPATGAIITPATSIAVPYIRSLACPVADQCTAVADDGESVTFDPLSTATPTGASIDPGVNLKAVSCFSSVECVAVDQVGDELVSAHLLSVSLAGSGSGSVSGSPIACPGTCSGYIGVGGTVALSATPTSGSTFAGWSGGGCSGIGTCSVTMSADQTVTATFNLNPPSPSPTPTPTPTPVAGVASVGTVAVSGSTATVAVTCTGDTPCEVTLALNESETLKGGKVVSVAKVKTKHKGVLVGSASAEIAAGQTQSVKIALNAAGTSLLAKHASIHPTLTVKEGTSVINTTSVSFRASKHKRKKH
jgi:hypothetical protein